MNIYRAAVILVVVSLVANMGAAEPLPDIPPIPRRLPPVGDALQPEQREQIAKALDGLHLRLAAAGNVDDPDVLIYEKAVRFALLHDEFYKKNDVQKALDLIDAANARLDALANDQHPWASQHGNVVRGYTSTIDGSAQPYGLEIPEGLDLSKPVPLYVWLHGRGDKTTDLHFIAQRQVGSCPISPFVTDGIILHPFGRQCIGYKSAGEIDVFEAIESVKQRYKIDDDRIALLGFSMGGAGAWHIGSHYADRFCVVHAGAGFVDVQRYQHLDPATIPPVERTLWGLYDVPDYVRNLFNIPVIAYSGEKDKQKASADIMEEVYAAQGRKLPRVIGPGMGHKYHPDSIKQVMDFVHDAVKKGRTRLMDLNEVHLQTRTLRYPAQGGIIISQLDQHWRDTRVDTAKDFQQFLVNIQTKNVREIAISFPILTGRDPVIDGQKIIVDGKKVSEPFAVFHRNDQNIWHQISAEQWDASLRDRKRPGLQGPIDDAFMEPFLLVMPSGKSSDARFEQWSRFEFKHFFERWRALYRGDPRMKIDTEVTDDDIANYHLVCFGDAESNKVIARLADKLPMKVREGDRVNLMIYPNPLNPRKYVVLNSGVTFRESHDRTNSLQNPKLGDWAIIDITTPPNGETPGKVIDCGFFDEQWKLSAVKQ
ncbi:prolyl oligopeptidase family serine peptidase [Planctomycetales bacterium ZRK34]|nr:prolyl oligopeptidase family serine peptidase [Planctomycetales bacterium ZRK34]